MKKKKKTSKTNKKQNKKTKKTKPKNKNKGKNQNKTKKQKGVTPGNPMNYTKQVMKHFQNPKHIKEMKNPSASGKVGNPRCGDVMQLFIKVKDNKIIDACFKTFGCVAAISASDALCDLVIGKTVEQAKKITNKDIINQLGELPMIKVHCSVLGKQALDAAIKNYENQQKNAVKTKIHPKIKKKKPVNKKKTAEKSKKKT